MAERVGINPGADRATATIRGRFKFSVDDISNGLGGEALRRWFAPNALARTLIMTHSGEYGSLNKRCFGQFSESLLHCSNHSPRGILIRPMEDLCLGLLLAPLLRPGSFCYSHCSSRHRLCLLLSALPLPLRATNQRAIWKSRLVSTLLPIFPSSSSMAKSAVLS